MNKLRNIIEGMFVKDDNNRHKVSYDLGKTITKGVKKILKLKLEDLKDD